MEESSVIRLRDVFAELLECIAPVITKINNYTWVGEDQKQFWEFLRRGALVRQYEALQTLLQMVDQGHGHFGVTLLRPAYEELIWIEYLTKHNSVAPDLCYRLRQYEVSVSLNAQNDHLGTKQMAALGFSQRFVKVFTAQSREVEAQIKLIGANLGWPKEQRTLLPSMYFLSKQVAREADYKFIYHATSRFVHFSSHELFRRVWGKEGTVSIGSSNFSEYWRDFAMYWSFRVFGELIVQCDDITEDFFSNGETFQRATSLLANLHPIPILTSRELESWSDHGSFPA